MRTMITGGAGFVGSHLCEKFLEAGDEVICVDNFITGRPVNIQHLRDHPRFSIIVHDASKPLRVDGLIDNVLHFASPASPIDYVKSSIQTLKIGSLGTHVALGIAKAHGAAFLLASTSEVYGDPIVHPQTESYWGNVNPVGERSMYDEAKRFSEALTMAFRRSSGVDTAIVRIFNTYGPRMAVDDGRMIPMFISRALRGLPLTVTGDGSQTRSLCFVSDTIDGLVAMAGATEPGPVNIGNPAETTVSEVAASIVARTGSDSMIEYVDGRPDDPQRRCPDIRRARKALGWEPRVSWEEGLDATLRWFADRLQREPLASGSRLAPGVAGTPGS